MKTHLKKRHIAAAVALAAITACVAPHKPQAPTVPQSPAPIVQHIGPAYLYPDPSLTPGKIATQSFADLTAHSSCGTYSQCHRQTTASMKDQVCSEYPDNCKAPHEIDHFCPLALGCADDVANLWAQPENNLWNGIQYGFHTKDKLEAYLAAQMKAGKITPADAQNCILSDWVACYQKYLGGNNLGAAATDPDQ